MNSKTALVTGGAGFIGSHLSAALVGKGYHVICIDNLLTGSKRNIEGLLSNERFRFIEHDVTTELPQVMNDVGTIDYLYHLASPASPVQYQNHPLETLHVNSIGTENMLQLAQQVGASFLYTSTSEVYGDPLEHPQKETYWGNVNSYGPRSCYDEAKRFGEALVYTYTHHHHVKARMVRIFNTYGPHMEKDDGRVVSNFVNQAINNQPVTIHGDGNQTRSFCYVSDMVSGIMAAMETEGTNGEIINLGNPDERSVHEIADLIIKLAGSSSEKNYKDRPPDDPARRQPDISKAKRLLRWEPNVSLEEGLKKTIEYFRQTANRNR